MTQYGDYYHCKVCGHVVCILKPGSPTLVCCEQPMMRLEAKESDEGKEKHIPVVVPQGNNTMVKLGSIPHPMSEEHYFCFIDIAKKNNQHVRARLNPGDEPQALFQVNVMDVDTVYAYCNIHGLWKKKIS